MKIKIRPEHASMLEMNDWLAELRDGENAEPTGPGNSEPTGPGPSGPGPSGPGYAVPTSYAVPASPGHAEPASYVRAVPAGPGYAVPPSPDCAEPAAASARPETLAGPIAPAASAATAAPARTATPAAPAAPAAPAEAAERAVIGDQLRMPIMWCEMGSCVSWHADPAALGEADTRARAIAAGWRIDALGRLACPRCQQTDPGFRASRPVAVWNRSMAITTTAPITARPGDGTAGSTAAGLSHDPGRAASGYPPACGAALEWHHDFPAATAMPTARYAENPAGTPIPAARSSVRPVLASLRRPRRRHLAKPSEHSEDLMPRERAHAWPAGTTTLTGRE